MTDVRRTEQRIVVVGAGLAGLRLVESLREGGHTGPIALVGAEEEPPYDRPPLSKQVLRGERDVVHLREDYDPLGVDLRLGTRAIALDPERKAITLHGGSVLSYDSVVIATGAVPRTLPGTEQYGNVRVLRTATDAYRLRYDLRGARRLTVIGGGFIGCEVAASARAMGVEVVIVEMLSRPLVRVLGDAVAHLVQELHESHGVEVHGSASVDAFYGEGQVTSLRLTDGAEIHTDVVLAGLGVVPDTAWLETSGLELDNGVVCDRFGQAAPGVWAVGDVARWNHVGTGEQHRLEHWMNAAEMAAAVAANILADESERTPYAPVAYVWSDQYDVKIQSVGFYHATDDVTLLRVGPKRRHFAIYGRDARVTGAVGFSAAPQMMKIRHLLVTGASVQDAIALVSG